MYFKNHKQVGMTFIEVVLAVFIIGSLLSSLLLLQSNVVKNVSLFTARSNRTFMIKDTLVQAEIDREMQKEPAKEQKIDDPKTTITYEQKKISKDSSLKKFEDIVIETVSAEWDEWGSKRKETMIKFLYKPEKKKA